LYRRYVLERAGHAEERLQRVQNGFGEGRRHENSFERPIGATKQAATNSCDLLKRRPKIIAPLVHNVRFINKDAAEMTPTCSLKKRRCESPTETLWGGEDNGLFSGGDTCPDGTISPLMCLSVAAVIREWRVELALQSLLLIDSQGNRRNHDDGNFLALLTHEYRKTGTLAFS
jgi:hypothetical protein